ncbi:MAG TPA: hypothetical protein VGR10_02530 [Thermoleophilaceae bacterium]|nr:hypothetical protein [Thermoleophilaceae bacterium]
MLGSITPLGERGRGSRWGLTVAAFVLASTMAGALLGLLLGAVGSAAGIGGSAAALWVLAGALLLGLVVEAAPLGLRLPTVERQVDDQWLYRYRGWVTGAGFGFQLGLGMVTIVTTALTYVAFLAAALSGSGAAGALVGGVYGGLRGATALLSARVDTPDRLARLEGWIRRWDPTARRVSVVVQAMLAAAAIAVILS